MLKINQRWKVHDTGFSNLPSKLNQVIAVAPEWMINMYKAETPIFPTNKFGQNWLMQDLFDLEKIFFCKSQ